MFGTAFRFILIVGVAVAAGCGQQAPANSHADAASKADSQKSGHAVRAYIDPKTGELRDPTPEELAQEAATEAQRKKTLAANPSSEQSQPKEVVTPSGAIEITLDDAAQHPLTACVTKDGDAKIEHAKVDRACDAQSSGNKK